MNTVPMNQRNIYFETLREQLRTVKIIVEPKRRYIKYSKNQGVQIKKPR